MTDRAWRVGVWCAVSSKPQADPEKDSLPAQEAAGRDFARAVGGQVVAVYRVPGHTRDYWSWYEAQREMPAYEQVRLDLQAGNLDVIHCLDSDRLGRDPALIQQFYSLAERCGCEIYDASMPHQLGHQHIGHRYGTAVKSVAAGEDQRRRVIRHRRGMQGRARRGMQAAGRWPPGYTELRDDLGKCLGAEFNEDIEAIRFVTARFLAGVSYDQILRELWARGFSLDGGREWYASLVQRCMKSDVYAGYTSWGGARNSQPSDKYPALWDDRTYAAILREREARARGNWHHPRSRALSGVAFCGRCGWRMGWVRARAEGEVYLRCSKHSTRRRQPGGEGCHPNHILESLVLAELSAWLSQFSTPEIIDAVLRQDTGLGELEAERTRIERGISGLETKRRRLALALAAGDMQPAIYRETDSGFLAELEEAQARLVEVETLIRNRPDPEERRAHLEHVLAQGLDLSTAPPLEVSAALRGAGVRVYCENRQIEHILFAVM